MHGCRANAPEARAREIGRHAPHDSEDDWGKIVARPD